MKKTNPNLQRAFRKLTYHRDREWGGYLTPSEIVALLDAGTRPKDGNWADYARERMAKGDSRPMWFYCFAPPGFANVRHGPKQE